MPLLEEVLGGARKHGVVSFDEFLGNQHARQSRSEDLGTTSDAASLGAQRTLMLSENGASS